MYLAGPLRSIPSLAKSSRPAQLSAAELAPGRTYASGAPREYSRSPMVRGAGAVAHAAASAGSTAAAPKLPRWGMRRAAVAGGVAERDMGSTAAPGDRSCGMGSGPGGRRRQRSSVGEPPPCCGGPFSASSDSSSSSRRSGDCNSDSCTSRRSRNSTSGHGRRLQGAGVYAAVLAAGVLLLALPTAAAQSPFNPDVPPIAGVTNVLIDNTTSADWDPRTSRLAYETLDSDVLLPRLGSFFPPGTFFGDSSLALGNTSYRSMLFSGLLRCSVRCSAHDELPLRNPCHAMPCFVTLLVDTPSKQLF